MHRYRRSRRHASKPKRLDAGDPEPDSLADDQSDASSVCTSRSGSCRPVRHHHHHHPPRPTHYFSGVVAPPVNVVYPRAWHDTPLPPWALDPYYYARLYGMPPPPACYPAGCYPPPPCAAPCAPPPLCAAPCAPVVCHR